MAVSHKRIAAFDAALFRKDYAGGSFKMHIGAGVVSSDHHSFKNEYDKAVDCLFENTRMKRKRRAYCASELSAIFSNLDNEEQMLSHFFKMISPHLDSSHFYYTFLPKIDKISVFGEGPGLCERVPVVSREKGKKDFFDIIEPSYTMLCAWKYSLDNPSDVVLMDNFQGFKSPAWGQLYGHRGIHVYYHGDQCNPFISTADLLVRLLKIRLLNLHERSSEETFARLIPELEEKFKLDFLGKRFLKFMAPHQRKRIKNSELLKHPIIFIIREDAKDDDELKMIKASPNFDKLLDYAYKKDGCIKFFHGDDSRIIHDGDVAFTLGDRGENILSKLDKLGTKLKKVNEELDI
jgi:hypothetical protein